MAALMSALARIEHEHDFDAPATGVRSGEPDIALAARIAKTGGGSGGGLDVRVFDSITKIGRDDWNRLFPGVAEDWDYFRACEQASPEGFTPLAIGVFAGGMLTGAATMFRVDYRLDMSLEGGAKRIAEWVARIAPRLIALPVLALGSPLTEECPIGIHPGLPGEERDAVWRALLDGMSDYAARNGISVLALKDVKNGDAAWADTGLCAARFTKVATLPVATLALPYRSVDDYLASLSRNVRHDIARKMKKSAHVTVEFRTSIDDVAGEIAALFQETRANSKADYGAFDDVPAAYFRGVMDNLGGRARVMLCRVDGVLACFNIFLHERDRVVGKYVGMRYSMVRAHNLYFVNWMRMVEFCIGHRIGVLQTGQTSYKLKTRMGCTLKRSWVYFKHRNAVANRVFQTFGPMLAFDRMDPDLRELGDSAVYDA